MDFVDTPAQNRDTTILELRDFSRKLVRELGFMRSTLAESDLAPSAVHAVLEIGMRPGINARDLGQTLRLDKSNTSRQVARLEADGFVERRACADDARSSALLRSLALYADALAQDNGAKASADTAAAESGPLIHEGYLPGCIGDIASLHARFYAAHWGFGAFFEQRVATELAAFAGSLPAAGKALWLGVENGRTLASLAIDGDLQTGIAHLRWFIVDDALRGSGMGRELMTRAMHFVDELGFRETYLCTFKGLDAARHLYESFGFALTDEAPGAQWGTTVTEQRFSRVRTP
jgi:DNA-binding MarR family transcriptional regulator/N-acetylglutamate synthase-like GNAT family acetyltransferase